MEHAINICIWLWTPTYLDTKLITFYLMITWNVLLIFVFVYNWTHTFLNTNFFFLVLVCNDMVIYSFTDLVATRIPF